MFAIYFLDSLAFLRIVAAPILVARTWQAADIRTLLWIGVVHMVGALIAGVLYHAVGVRPLFVWVLGIFPLLHLSYAIHVRLVPESYVSLGTAVLYALAVSMYTVVSFAIWADLATPRTVALNSALGVALSAWTATYLATALSLWWGVVSMVPVAGALAWILVVAAGLGAVLLTGFGSRSFVPADRF